MNIFEFRNPNLCVDSKPEKYKARGCIGTYCPLWGKIVFWRYKKSDGTVVHPERLHQYAHEGNDENEPYASCHAVDYTPCLPHCKKCGEKIKIIESRMVYANTAITTCFSNMRLWG